MEKIDMAIPGQQAIAYAHYEDQIIRFYPLEENAIEEVFADWVCDPDSDLFYKLEHGYKLVGMSMGCHFFVWETIEEWYNGNINNIDGMQKYLRYCKINHITLDALQKLGFNGMDVMRLYERQNHPKLPEQGQ